MEKKAGVLSAEVDLINSHKKKLKQPLQVDLIMLFFIFYLFKNDLWADIVGQIWKTINCYH